MISYVGDTLFHWLMEVCIAMVYYDHLLLDCVGSLSNVGISVVQVHHVAVLVLILARILTFGEEGPMRRDGLASLGEAGLALCQGAFGLALLGVVGSSGINLNRGVDTALGYLGALRSPLPASASGRLED